MSLNGKVGSTTGNPDRKIEHLGCIDRNNNDNKK